MSGSRDRLWVAEFSGPHIEGTAYLALPTKSEGFTNPYVREPLARAVVEAARAVAGGGGRRQDREKLRAALAAYEEATE